MSKAPSRHPDPRSIPSVQIRTDKGAVITFSGCQAVYLIDGMNYGAVSLRQVGEGVRVITVDAPVIRGTVVGQVPTPTTGGVLPPVA